jgi:hypothetical protein
MLSLLFVLNATAVFANTAIETETAQIGKKGDFAFSQSVEFGKSKDGTSGGTLTQFEYAISDRAEILIEPFFYQWDSPIGEPKESGVGDLEITPSYMVVIENSWVPAVLVATKVKVPTGSKDVGGTKKYDYYPYLIFGQHYGDWTFNANIGVNFARPAEGGAFERTRVWDVEAEHELAPNWTGFYEVFSAEDGVKTVSTAVQYQLTKHFNAFFAISYNEDHEVIVRPGLNIEF